MRSPRLSRVARVPSRAALLAATLAAAATASTAAAQTAAPGDSLQRDLARRVVASAGGIRPGEYVVITGGAHVVPLMEAVAIEVTRAGGVPTLELQSERVARAYLRDLPVQYIRAADTAATAMYGATLRHADVMIGFPQSEHPELLAQEFNADTARMGAVMAAFTATQERWDRMRNESRTRFVTVNYPPTPGSIARSGLDSTAFAQMQWAAVTADPVPIERAGRAIAQLMERGRELRITTPAGTDLRVPLAGRRAAVNTGVVPPSAGQARLAAFRSVGLPGGQVSVAPLETGATGRVVIPRSDCAGGQTLVNARFEFRGGRMSGVTADSGATCITNYLATSGPTAGGFAYVLIGLNPGLRVVESGRGYYPWSASGLVHIGVGNNADLGGRNATPSGRGWALTGATVAIDGTVVVRDGQLTEAVTATR
jgi:leucyl aminopeptidase (aminopeptidase T)